LLFLEAVFADFESSELWTAWTISCQRSQHYYVRHRSGYWGRLCSEEFFFHFQHAIPDGRLRLFASTAARSQTAVL